MSYLVIEITGICTRSRRATIVENNLLNRIFYAGRVVFSGTLEDCEEELMNY